MISACIAVEVNRIVHMPAAQKTVYNKFQNWNESSKDLFLKKIFDPMISNKLYILCQTNFPCSNAAAKQFMEIISGVIKSVFRRNRGTMQQINIHIPYDKALQIAKRQFKKYKGQLSRYPTIQIGESDLLEKDVYIKSWYTKWKRNLRNWGCIRLQVLSKMNHRPSGKI